MPHTMLQQQQMMAGPGGFGPPPPFPFPPGTSREDAAHSSKTDDTDNECQARFPRRSCHPVGNHQDVCRPHRIPKVPRPQELHTTNPSCSRRPRPPDAPTPLPAPKHAAGPDALPTTPLSAEPQRRRRLPAPGPAIPPAARRDAAELPVPAEYGGAAGRADAGGFACATRPARGRTTGRRSQVKGPARRDAAWAGGTPWIVTGFGWKCPSAWAGMIAGATVGVCRASKRLEMAKLGVI